MDLLEALGLSRPVADCATCLELYYDGVAGGEALENLKEQCMQLLQPFLSSYIWQHEPLQLHSSVRQQPPWLVRNKQGAQRCQQQQQQQQPPCLWAVVRYEDCVDDEWFVVWLLLHLTQQLPGLTARCWDDDGEFLLIEAAYSLPRWLKPESSTNRVWLRAGQLHIIPPPSTTHPTLPSAPSVGEALAILRSGSVATRRRRVEAAIRQRLLGYPSKASQQLQRTIAWLPRRLALLLAADPQIVAGAAAAFMTRQRDEVQAASKLRLFPATDMTTARVTLNRCMYAQLMQADFAPPKSYPSPPGGNWLGGEAAKQHKAVSMGLKIATGMELMALRLGLQPQAPAAAAVGSADTAEDEQQQQHQQSTQQTPQQQQQQQQRQQQQQQQDMGLASNPAWHAYKAVLQRSGYFDGELEGSARYRQLLAAAQTAFTSSDAYEASTAALAAPKQHLLQLLAAVEALEAAACNTPGAAAANGSSSSSAPGPQLQQQQQWLSPVAAVLDVDQLETSPAEDGDGWMSVEAEELQQRLAQAEMQAAAHSSQRQQQHGAGDTSNNNPTAAAPPAAAAAEQDADGAVVDAEDLVAGFRGFVQHMAGVEGAEVPTAAAAAAAAAGTDTAAGSSGVGRKRNNGGNSSQPSAVTLQQQQQRSHQKVRRQQQQEELFADDLDFDPSAFLSELLGALGAAAEPLQQQQQASPAAAAAALQKAQQLQQQLEQQLARFEAAAEGGRNPKPKGHAAPNPDAADSDDYGDSEDGSSDEGSSFYGSSGSESSEEDEEADPLGALGQDACGLGSVGLVPRARDTAAAVTATSGAAAAAAAAFGAAAAAGAGEPVLLQVAPPVSQRLPHGRAGQQQQQQQRQQQQAQQQQQAGHQPGQQQHQGQRQQQQRWQQWAGHDDAWEAMTATDSDDDDDALSIGGSSGSGSDNEAAGGAEASREGGGGATAAAADGFYDSYAAALEAELAATTLAQTFERLQATPAAGPGSGAQDPSRPPAGPSCSATSAAAAAGVSADAGLTPVDVDFNLIKSLVASYAAQGGLPGPASNLAGLLGLQLPTEVELQEQEAEVQQQQHGKQ